MWPILLLILIVIVIVVIKKTKKNKEKEKYRKFLVDFIDNKKNDKEFFSDFYGEALKEQGLSQKELDALFKRIPQYKSEYSTACQELAEIGKSNVCLMSDKDAGASLTTERITKDIIEVLPRLARFYKEYDHLYKNIYDDVFNKKVTTANMWYLFAKLDNKENERHYFGLIDKMFNYIISNITCDYLGIERIDIRECDDAEVVRFVQYADEIIEAEDLAYKHLRIFMSGIEEIGDKNIQEGMNLNLYFREVESDMKNTLPWFSTKNFALPSSCLVIDNPSEKECLRILNLYKTGKMRGKYSKALEKKR